MKHHGGVQKKTKRLPVAFLSLASAPAFHDKRLDDGEKLTDAIWFEQKPIGASRHGPLFIRRDSRCQDTGNIRISGLDALDQFKAVNIGDMDIRKNHVDRVGSLNVPPSRKTGAEGMDFAVYAELEGIDHKITHQRVIFHHSNLNVGYDCPPHAVHM